jgi:hypothetical protein
MTNTTIPSGGKKRTPLAIGGIALALAVVIYFAFFYPPVPSQDAAGTIGKADRYRSEQITEGDVHLGSEHADAAAVVAYVPADETTTHHVYAAAASLDKAATAMAAKAGLDKNAVASFDRAARTFARTVEMSKNAGLSRNAASSLLARAEELQKTSRALEAKSGLEKAEAASLDRNARSLELAAYAASLDMMARSMEKSKSLDRTSALDLQRTAAGLEKFASYGAAASLDAKTVAEVLERATGLERNVRTSYEMKSVLEKNAAADLAAKSQELSARIGAFEKSFGLEAKEALEMKSSLDRNARAE